MAEEIIQPIKEKEIYILEDKDYLLVKSIKELSNQINKLIAALNR